MDDAVFFAGLRPELAALARLHRDRCAAERLRLVWITGLRSWEEQMAAFGVGRTRTPAGWRITGQIVTRALPDNSPHCRGAAYDCAPLSHEHIDWAREDLFRAVADLAPDGLVWGGSFGPDLQDLDHYEITGWRDFPVAV